MRSRFWNNLHQGQKIGNHNNLNVVYNKNTKGLTQDSQNSAKEEFEDTKGAIRIRISKKNIQHNGQKKKLKNCYFLQNCQ